ncbi:hypothetical protein E2C01_070416 [Portunus trituberculatus]|uniref:Uncharacterized protein n=1 Tax=Portunus trituberculatus TaxID=210409 RepID=A0A5B7I1I1_PORTR|nr:hypothetical protein [Portunus trituberculatus]
MHASPSGTWTPEQCYFPLAARSRSGTRPSPALSQAPRRGGETRCNGTPLDGNISSHRRVHCHWQQPTMSTLAQPSSAKWLQSCSANLLLNRSPFHSRKKGTKTLPSGTVLHRHFVTRRRNMRSITADDQHEAAKTVQLHKKIFVFI